MPPLKARYRRAMEALYVACIAASGIALVLITLAIPYGVFMRYVVNSAASWPEPFAVVLMVFFSFVGGAAVYRANAHIAVRALLDAVPPAVRDAMHWIVHACMAAMCGFMLVYGTELVRATWNQSIPEFPGLSVGVTYLPIPLCGLLTALFILEKLWVGEPPRTSIMYRDDPEAVE